MPRFPLAFITDEFTQDFDQAVQTAVELGYQALEVRMAWGKNIVDLDDGQIAAMRRSADAAGLRIISVASPVFKCTHPAGGEIDQRFQQDAFNAKHQFEDQPSVLDRALQVAEALGAPIVRVFSFWRTLEPPRLFGHIVESLSMAIDKAARHRIRIGLENEHACNIATAVESAPVLRTLTDPNFGLVWDPANSYVAGETPFPDGYSLLPASRIIHVHAKDGAREGDKMIWGVVGQGRVGWQQQLEALARDGYHGSISLETHWGGPGGDKFAGSWICATKLKHMVERVA